MVKSIYGAGPLFPGQPFATPEGLARLIDMLLANGINKFDAAQTYGGGQTESFLGWCGAGKRMVIDTKHCGGWISGQSSAEDVVRRGKDSLKKLNVSKVDTFYIHAPDRTTPIEETLHGINQLYELGAFERFGISNYTADEVEEIVQVCRTKGYIVPAVFQGPLLRYWSPQAGGFLAKSKEKFLSHDVEGRWSAEDEAGQFFQSGIPRAELAYRWTAFNSQLSDEYDDRIIWSGSSEEQVQQTIAGLSRGHLPADIAKKIDNVWDLVKNDSPLDHFNRNV
ncbi:NADP-dependent oxidoreductase domain-containing protein [Trichoderma velutinum]